MDNEGSLTAAPSQLDDSVPISRFVRNEAVNGGGVYINALSTAFLNYGMFSNNKASQDGGGMYCSGDATLVQCDFYSNSAGTIGVGGDGGGLRVTFGTVDVLGGTFQGNSAVRAGGGLAVGGLLGGAVNADGVAFISNTDATGGNVYVLAGGTYNQANCTYQ